MEKIVYISADHRGFELKNKLLAILKEKGYTVEDLGPFEYKEYDDYVDYVIPTVNKVLDNRNARGIVICKNGVGVSMLANKFKGIRCGLCFNDKHSESAVSDDDINILALPALFIPEAEALETVQDFLETHFSGQERHIRRLDKISDIEEQNFK